MNIVCAADCGIDRYVDLGVERPGGIGLNVAMHLRALCDAADVVSVLAPIGHDEGGRIVREAVVRAGIDDRLELRAGTTPVQRIRHPAGAERQFERYEEGVLAGFELREAGRDLIASADILTMAAFGQGLDLFESVIACPSRGLRVVDFTNANDIGDPLAFVERHAARFDVGVFGLTPEDDALIDGLEALARRLGRLLVVTLGAEGSVALGGAARCDCLALEVDRVIDTTGAGDAFLAGFAWSYAGDRDVAGALARGSEVASRTLARLGSF
jgi:sugar/nucleoside kinase (ribokinase family)